MMNGLAELQPMWPAFVKNDGVGGLTVDPTLYASSFGPQTKAEEGGLNSENDTPGVRVEAIKDDGTVAASDDGSNTTFKVTLSGAGSFNPRCKVHQAGIETEFLLIAPSKDTKANAEATYASTIDNNDRGWAGAMDTINSAGPYPVFMTVQEFAEMLDTYRHIGTNDDEKKAFLPHGNQGGGLHSTSSAAVNPTIASDPRTSSNTNWPADDSSAAIAQTLVRATVFMPMMLDNNQLDQRSTNADQNFAAGWPPRYLTSADADLKGFLTANGTGLSRYDQQPDGDDKTVIRYKNLGQSGDHKIGKVGAWSFYASAGYTHGRGSRRAIGYSNADISLDSSPSLGPKYRMRMALACFLRNGEYDITDGGTLIPYVYDADRTIGGKNTMTLYQVWNGWDGYGAAGGHASNGFMKDCDAQIYPMFDFVQGPICPAAQGENAGMDAIQGTHRAWPNVMVGKYNPSGKTGYAMGASPSPRMYSVRPNPRRLPVFGVEISNSGRIKFYVELTGTSDTVGMRWGNGMPIYVNGMTGKLGSGTQNVNYYPDTWMATLADGPTANQTAFTSTKGMNLNGWWVCYNNSDNGSGTSTTYNSLFSDGDNTAVRYVTIEVQTMNKFFPATAITKYRIGSASSPTTAFIRQGRLGGYMSGATAYYYYGQYPLSSNYAQYYNSSTQNIRIPGVPSWQAGAASSDSNVPVANNDTYPGRPTIFKATTPNQAGVYASDLNLTPRSIGPRKDGDATFAVSPTASTMGGGSLRVPPPVGWDIAWTYMCRTDSTNLPTVSTTYPTNDYGENVQSGTNPQTNRFWMRDAGLAPKFRKESDSNSPDYTSNAYSRWIHRGLSLPFWSYMDNKTGRHAFDHIKPVSASGTWLFGRNRPWPIHERLGTRHGYTPSLLSSAKSVANDGDSYDGWENYTPGTQQVPAGEETTKTGLSEMGCSPVWIDCEIRGWFPVQENRMTIIEFDNNQTYPLTGRHSMITGWHANNGMAGFGFHPLNQNGQMQYPNASTSGNQLYGSNNNSDVWSSFSWTEDRRPAYSVNRPAVYVWGNSPYFDKGYAANADDKWTNSASWPYGNGVVAFGSLGNGVGTGSSFNATEGTNTVRTFFTEAGQTMILNGSNKGTDPNGATPVWGMTIKACDTAVSTGANNYDTLLKNSSNEMFHGDDPNNLISTKDFQLDYLHLRQIPSPSMTPFNVDSLTQKITDIAKYTQLSIEAENVKSSNGMLIKVSIMTAPTPVSGRPQAAATTVVPGFEEIDPQFVAGLGVVDLTELPAAQVTNGFVIRYHFYIPDSTQTEYHPIDWSSIPIIRKWTLNYDLKPTASLAVIGNSFSGDLSSPIGTEVGHIISFRGTGTTTDPDRLISSIKFDFGDGSNTGWLNFSDQTLQSTTYDTAHVYSKAGTFSATILTKDDNENVSVASSVISVVVAEVKPVALLRAIPQMVRAGQAINFDASESYTLSSDTARTIASYTFNFGDGSSATSGASPSATHTFAAAGEYMATVTATDNASPTNTSQAAKVVVKILPATLVVPLALNTMPSGFQRTRRASFSSTEVLDAVYPEMADTGQRSDEFKLTGSFLKATANADIDFMEELLVSGALVEFEWEAVNYSGSATGKTFVGRLTNFDYEREGGKHGETPWSASLIREAGLGN
jgi:plastocyanin